MFTLQQNWKAALVELSMRSTIRKTICLYHRKFLVTGTIVIDIGKLYVYTHDKDCRYN
jgi:hypothetical protein